MRRIGTTILGLVAALTLLLLLVNLNVGYTTDQTNSQQSVASAHNTPAPMGRKLTVFLTGDLTLAPHLKQQLPQAIRTKELPFDEVRFVDAIPQDALENPFLAINLEADRGFWTPVYATRRVTATFYYAQGRPLDPNEVVAPSAVTAFSNATCIGQCSEGHRTVDLNTVSRGLVSLPHVRAYVAGKLSQEAVALVAGGLPENLNPDKWSNRARTLAEEKLGKNEVGFSTFAPLAGCRGGILVIGSTDYRDQNWSLMYYDAERDAITGTLSRDELQAKMPGVSVTDYFPGGGNGPDGWKLFLGQTSITVVPAGTCSLGVSS